MSLKERTYSILIVSAAEGFKNALSTLLPEAKYNSIHSASSISAAKRACAERNYDYIIINAPLPDEVGTRFAIDICNTSGTVVLLFSRVEVHEEIYDKVAEYGVFTLPMPTARATIAMALNWMASTRERLRKNEKQTLTIEEKMEEIRLVNRAKWLLISELKMDEQGAHRYIEKQAMDRCITKKMVAKEIIKTYT